MKKNNKEKEIKSQEVTEITETQDQKDKTKHYDFGHLVLHCGKCNSKYIIEENMPGDQARQIILAPTSTSGMRLVCKDCENEMSLFFIESSKKNDKETIQKESANESVPEEGTITAELV
jgi:DNA-directed RNA polymerase subunit M/transcription elongation factor TFIIS